MTVNMSTNYARLGGPSHVLSMDDSDLVSLNRNYDAWRIEFRGEVPQTLTGLMTLAEVEANYVKKEDLEEDYISKELLAKLLGERREVYKKVAHQCAMAGSYTSAQKNTERAIECTRIIADVEIDEIEIP